LQAHSEYCYGGHAAAEKARRFSYDRSLLTALVDRWRPETHTFHMPVGEMAPTLQDVSFLLGLPCAGAPVSVPDIPAGWRESLNARFSIVQRKENAPPYVAVPAGEKHGPSKKWILQFAVRVS
jgi:hypothetical protein